MQDMRRIVTSLLVIGSLIYTTSAWEATTSQNVQITVSSDTRGSNLLPADRDASANWRMAGLLSIGGIPNRTTVCATVNPRGGGQDDTGSINTAISNCPSGQVVQLGAGTYAIRSNITLNKGVTLRGAGPGSTNLHAPNGAVLGSNATNRGRAIINAGGSGTSNAAVNLSTDRASGSTSVVLNCGGNCATAGFAVGGFAQIDEVALGQWMPDAVYPPNGKVWAESDYRVEWNAHNPPQGWDTADGSNVFTSGDSCDYSIKCGAVNTEIKQIAAISGNTVTFDSPLMFSYRVNKQARLVSYPLSSFVQQAGVESLTMSNGDAGNLEFSACAYCWAKNVESTMWLNEGGIAFYSGAFRDQVEKSWIHDAAWPVNGGGGYAVNLTFGASEILFEDSIVMKANKVVVMRASGAGSVIAYNYMDDGYIDGTHYWIETGLNCSHLVGSHHALFEGNQSFNIDSDFTHGASNHCTYFRNYLTGYRAPFNGLDGFHYDDHTCCGPLRCFADHAYAYWESFIGNICGVSGDMSGWVLSNTDLAGAPPAVWKLGWNDISPNTADATVNTAYPNSPSGTITGPGCLSSGTNCATIQDGNFNYLTNSIQWASNDTAHTLPNSFYLSSKPAFFTGGASVWPPVDPINGVVHAIPAKARWDAGTPFTQP
jgi:hypothetical protein